MVEVVMPKLSDTMEEGTIVEWLIADGETVATGDELVEIQTDKAVATYEAEEDGVLQIHEQSGRTVPIGARIAELS
jgi:pyruvate dehydrogenase E2 component (dihydrolipoyllysine-residue acetyltransferase)